MSKKTILLRDLITRLAQSEAGELYVEVEETEPDVFVLPLSFLFGTIDSAGVVQRLLEEGGLLPIVPILDFQENNAIIGNDTQGIGSAAAEVWELRSISLLSDAGATYAIEDDGVKVAPSKAIGAAATGELVAVNVPVAGGSLIGIDAGALADRWNLRAVRLK